MDILFLSVAVFLVCRWLIKNLLTSTNEQYDVEPPTIINNYTTENHLHISEDQLSELSKKN